MAPVAVLALALLIGFAGLVARPAWLIVDGDRPWVDELARPGGRPIGNDLTSLFLPRHLWQSEQWRAHGRVPLWDPRGSAGRPNAGNPQAGIWYPPAWLAWTWGDPAAPGWLTVGHLLWAGIGSFALGRALGLGRAAATTSGAVVMLNPYVIAQVLEGHLPHVWSASWYPWAFLGGRMLRQGRRAGWAVLTASVALSLSSGHPQEGVYLVIALGCWALLDVGAGVRCRARPTPPGQGDAPETPDRAAGHSIPAFGSGGGAAGDLPPDPREGSRSRPLIRPLRLMVAIGLAIGLAGVTWVPVLAARPWVAGPLGGEGGGGGGPYHLWPSNVLQLVSPRALGGPADFLGRGTYWETMVSIGWASLVLLVLGVARSSDRSAVRGWCVLLGVSLLHACGDRFGLSAILGDLPGMGGVRVPSRSLFLAMMAAAMLSGMGVDVVDRGVGRRAARRYAAAVCLLALAAGAGIVSGPIREEAPMPIGPVDRWSLACRRLAGDWLLFASVAATGGVLARGTGGRPGAGNWTARAMGLVAIAELAASAAMTLPVCPPERFLGADAVSGEIEGERPPQGSRIRSRDAFYSDLHAWRDRLEKTNLGDLFQVRHAAEIYRALYPIFDEPGPRIGRGLDRRLARSALDRLGVSRIVSDRPLLLEVGPLVGSGVRGGIPFEIIGIAGAMPRAYVVPRAEVVPESETVGLLPEVDPRMVVLLSDPPGSGFRGHGQSFKEAFYDGAEPDRVIVRVATEAPGFMVVTDAWMPGWSATLDGRPTALLRGDHAFRVVPLPVPGDHRVVMSYRAPGQVTGSLVSAASAIVLIGVMVGSARGRRAPGGGVDGWVAPTATDR